MKKLSNRILSTSIDLALLFALGFGGVVPAQAQEPSSPPFGSIISHGKGINPPPEARLQAAFVDGITGTVTDAQSGEPLQGVSVTLFYCQWSYFYCEGFTASTDAAGMYTITGLGTGTFYLRFDREDYLPIFYHNKSSLDAADAILVTSGAETPNIDQTLVKGGSITGRVTAVADGTPLQDAWISLYNCTTDSYSCQVNSTSTDLNGTYSFAGLTTGNYYLEFGRADYRPKYYNNKTNLATADPIPVTLGVETPNINAALILGGKITGKVTAADGGASLQDATVYVFDSPTASDDGSITSSQTDGSGTYTLTGLATGYYYLKMVRKDYVPSYYNNKFSLATVDAVSVTVSAVTTGINAALILGGRITGQVTAAEAGAPLEDIFVGAYDSPFDNVYTPQAYSLTDAAGRYAITGLVTGDYYIKFSGFTFPDTFYNNETSLTRADAIHVALSEETPDINAALTVGGRITGKVTAADGSTPLGGVYVYLFDSPGASEDYGYLYSTQTDEFGEYHFTELLEGNYYLKFLKPTDLTTYYNFYDQKTSLAAADVVSLKVGEETSNINSRLPVPIPQYLPLVER